MDQWSDLSNSVGSLNSGAGIFAQLLESFPDLQVGDQPLNLLDFNNSFTISNNPTGLDNSGYDRTDLTWTNNWSGTFKWELKADFNWSISDVIDPLTNETTHLRVNPFLDTYAYLVGYFSWVFNEFWFIEVSAYIQPFWGHLIELDFWKGVNYPEWWTRGEAGPASNCMGLKAATLPGLVEVDFDFGWPVCSWSLESFMTWVDPVQGASNSFKRRIQDADWNCKQVRYGKWSSDMDVPFWKKNFFNHWKQDFEIVPFECQVITTGNVVPLPQAPFCDVKTDKQCVVGCKPSPNNPDCLPNPNFAAPTEDATVEPATPATDSTL